MGLLINPFGFGVAPPSWTPLTIGAPSIQSASWAGYTLRQRVDSSIISSAFGRCRFSIEGGTTEAITITDCYIGIQGVGSSFDFSVAPTRVTFNGGSNSCVAPASTKQFSDTITLSRTAGQHIVISLWTVGTATAADNYLVNSNVTGTDSAYKNANDPTSLSASGYTPNSHQCHIADFEISP